MRLLSLVTAAAIGLSATAALAQSQNTADPNSAPGATQAGKGQVMKPASGDVKKMNTSDPNSAPGASATGGKAMGPSAAENSKNNTADPNTATTGAGGQKMKKSKKKKSM